MRKSLNHLLETIKSQFAQDETTIGTTHLTKMQIDMGDSEPVSQKPYPIAMEHYDWVRSKITNSLMQGSPQQPFQLVSTYHCSAQGRWWKHQVIDNRALNKVTWKFIWPMPTAVNIFSKLNSARYFSILNLYAGYHHIPLKRNLFPKQPSPLYLENMSTWKFPFD